MLSGRHLLPELLVLASCDSLLAVVTAESLELAVQSASVGVAAGASVGVAAGAPVGLATGSPGGVAAGAAADGVREVMLERLLLHGLEETGNISQ